MIATLLYLANPEALTAHQRTRIEESLAGFAEAWARGAAMANGHSDRYRVTIKT